MNALVPHRGDAEPAPLSRAQKAALVLAVLGPDAAGPIIERVGDQHLRAFAEAYARVKRIPREQLTEIVAEFVSNFAGADGDIYGSFERAKELIAHFKGEDPTDRLLEDVSAPGGPTVWQRLESVKDAAIAEYLTTQHPQVMAVVISKLNPEKASAVLGKLDLQVARKVVRRLSQPMQPRKEALRVLADTIERDFLLPAKRAAKAFKPGEMVGTLMNNMPSEKRDALMKFIEEDSPEILDDVKSVILTFQDIPARVPANAIPMLVREVEADVFLKAVKFGKQNAPEAVTYIFKNISQRMVGQYEEQMTAMKQITVLDAEAAQAAMMQGLRRLVASGDIKLVEPVSDDADAPKEVYI